MDARVLVVCTANVCRSPLAAALLARGLVATAGLEVVSAGVHAHVGDAACTVAADEFARSTGDAPPSHLSRPLDDELLHERPADLIVTATTAQRRAVLLAWPERAGRVYTLRELEALLGVVDPGRPVTEIDHLLDALHAARGLARPAVRGRSVRSRDPEDAADIADGHVLGWRAHRRTVREVDRTVRSIAAELRRLMATSAV